TPVEPININGATSGEVLAKPTPNGSGPADSLTTAALQKPAAQLPSIDRSTKPAAGHRPVEPKITPRIEPKLSANGQSAAESHNFVVPRDNSAEFYHLQPIYGSTSSGIAGLRNLGNSCFLSAAMQCLAVAPGLSGFYLGSAYMHSFKGRRAPWPEK